MAWIQEQRMPLHLHVEKGKEIRFNQWRIMSMAEFGFVSVTPGMRFFVPDNNSNYRQDEAKRKRDDKERAEKRAREEAAAAKKAAEENEKKRQGNYMLMFTRLFANPAMYGFRC
jgi:hypothetical protein